MDKAGAQEMLAPVLHPISLWKETNRTNSVGFELMAIKDRNETEFVLGRNSGRNARGFGSKISIKLQRFTI